jgi:hypothetical protein
MAENIRKAVAERGFVLLRQLAPELETIEAMERLGTIVQATSLPSIQTLKPKVTAEPNTYSGNYGLGEFPLHSDLAHWTVPPQYLGLRCLSGIAGVHTKLLDGNDLIDGIGSLRLQRTLVQPRRLLARGRPLLRLLDESNVGRILRWDDIFVVPATPSSAITVKDIQQFLASACVQRIELILRGDTLIVDNWRMLHGRSSISPSSVSRHLERVYFGDLF